MEGWSPLPLLLDSLIEKVVSTVNLVQRKNLRFKANGIKSNGNWYIHCIVASELDVQGMIPRLCRRNPKVEDAILLLQFSGLPTLQSEREPLPVAIVQRKEQVRLPIISSATPLIRPSKKYKPGRNIGTLLGG